MPSPSQPPMSRSEGSAPTSLLAHHLLHRAEEREPRQRGLHLHDPRLQIQDRVRSFQNLLWNPQAPRHQTHPLVSTGNSKVFYLKNKGDCHRYLVEFKIGTLTA
ncbi:hypothetical protein FCV25MIE_33357 [Fagus crenata]